MRYSEWKRDSAVFAKSRSTELKAIDTAFERYEKAKTGPNIRLLADAIAAWKVSKGVGASIRDEAVRRLADWVLDERYNRGDLWHPEPQWGYTQNCYAYAMHDTDPDNTGGHSVPGGASADPQLPGLPNYHARLIAAVIEDARLQRKVIQHVPQAGLHPVPGYRPGHYLAVMVGNVGGFHWLRRASALDQWSHKNGAGELPETTCLHVPSQKVHGMTTNVVMAMIGEGTKLQWFSGFQGMSFIAYFHVPNGGIRVARGIPVPPPLPPLRG